MEKGGKGENKCYTLLFVLQKYYPIEACVLKIFLFSMKNELINQENLKILTKWENMIKKGEIGEKVI